MSDAAAGTLTRRRLLAIGTGTVGALVLAACGGTRPTPPRTPPGTAHYLSRPDLSPTLITQRGPAGAPGAGFVCVTPSGPMLVDDFGDPVWVRPVPHAAANLRVQRLGGRPVLTWWQGQVTHYGVGFDGEYVVLDESYRQLMTVKAQHGLSADLHEFIISGDGVAYFTAYRQFTTDLRAVGGPAKGTALDATIQGVDLVTGALVFDWHSADHIEVTESQQAYRAHSTAPYDPVHLNSIDFMADGTLLVSARNTWAVYKIDPATGAIVWRLGGKKSDFTLGPGVRFAWQHDARTHPDGTMTLFDDEGDPPEAKQSRGLVLAVDETAKKVTLVRQYVHPRRPLLAGSQGSVQVLANGDVLVGWGAEPYYTEYRADGTTVVDARFEHGQSYRAFRFPWRGSPTERPAVAARRVSDGVTVYASWNGSTDTVSWEVLGGRHRTGLSTVGAAQKTGFETPITTVGDPDYVAVVARDGAGRRLASSGLLAV